MILSLVRPAPVLLALVILSGTGCASVVPAPPELVDARAAYSRAQAGPAARMDPAALHEADTALTKAERAFRDDPSAPETRDLAVVAGLRVRIAEARAASLMSVQDKAQAEADMKVLQAHQLANAKAASTSARADATKSRAQLDAERLKGVELEKKLKTALASLARIAAIKDTARGLIITFQGDMLFKSGEATLRPEAIVKLDRVVESLMGQERRIVIEGHTDNQGGAGPYNQTLSEQRANAVRDYMIGKGIPSDMVRSTGFGPSTPVANNSSAEGRAANRRVEIVVEPRNM